MKDDRLRDAIRIALRIHRQTAEAPDDYTRLRIRARVLGNLRPRGAGLADHAWTALELLARPAPMIARSFALAALLVAVGMGATVASADTLPDDLLYPVKVAAEGVRLALAGAPEDRAEVELSIAEHRLREAERLAASGRTSDALVAAAVYSQHIAWAAAELAPRSDSSDLPQQLESRFAVQRDRAQTLAASLANDAKSAPAARILAMIGAPTLAPGVTGPQRVAYTAAGVAEQLVKAAEQAEVHTAAPGAIATPAGAREKETTPAAPPTDARTTITTTREARPTATVTTQDATATSRPRETSRTREADATPRTRVSDAEPPTQPASSDDASVRRGNEQGARPSSRPDGRSSEVLKVVRKALEEAKAAADKTKQHK
ncbi:MAG TPA: DUF5667 domain-containing protein [Candidatus Limnocylindria bacterium]|nr:DUF5667 domain-containing protein [Candidatus Limnocylindria bacterium]